MFHRLSCLVVLAFATCALAAPEASLPILVLPEGVPPIVIKRANESVYGETKPIAVAPSLAPTKTAPRMQIRHASFNRAVTLTDLDSFVSQQDLVSPSTCEDVMPDVSSSTPPNDFPGSSGDNPYQNVGCCSKWGVLVVDDYEWDTIVHSYLHDTVQHSPCESCWMSNHWCGCYDNYCASCTACKLANQQFLWDQYQQMVTTIKNCCDTGPFASYNDYVSCVNSAISAFQSGLNAHNWNCADCSCDT